MSTRSAIARLTGREPLAFEGRYHHWDGYPTGLGRALWTLYHGHFQRDLSAMLEVLIDRHPAGWSTIIGADFTREPGFQELRLGGTTPPHTTPSHEPVTNGSKTGDPDAELPHPATPHPAAPQCYCHGTRSEAGWEVTQDNASGSGCEYAYVFPPVSEQAADRMLILSSYIASGDKMVGMFGLGDPQAQWRVLAEVLLQDQEPDWEQLDAQAWDAITAVEASRS